MTHTGIRLKITVPGGTILDADSDWLHMNALMHAGGEIFAGLMAGQDPAPIEHPWVEVAQLVGGPIQIWIQPVNLADEHPDDEDQAEPEDEHAGECGALDWLALGLPPPARPIWCHAPAGHDGEHRLGHNG